MLRGAVQTAGARARGIALQSLYGILNFLSEFHK